MSAKHLGSTVDKFLKEEGIFEEAQSQSVEEILKWELELGVKRAKVAQSRMKVLLDGQ